METAGRSKILVRISHITWCRLLPDSNETSNLTINKHIMHFHYTQEQIEGSWKLQQAPNINPYPAKVDNMASSYQS